MLRGDRARGAPRARFPLSALLPSVAGDRGGQIAVLHNSASASQEVSLWESRDSRPTPWKRRLYAAGLRRIKDAEILSDAARLSADEWSQLEALLTGAAQQQGVQAAAGFRALPTKRDRLLALSHGYRQDIADYVSALDAEIDAVADADPPAAAALALERHLYAGVAAAWHLAELLHLQSPSAAAAFSFAGRSAPAVPQADPLPARLLAWLNAHFPAPPPGALDALEAAYAANRASWAGPADSPDYWPLVTRCVLRGNLQGAALLLDLLPGSSRPQHRAAAEALCRVFLECASSRPDPARFLSDVEYEAEWSRWKEQVLLTAAESSLAAEAAHLSASQTPSRRSARLARGDDDPGLVPRFSILLRIVAGDEESVQRECRTWHERLACGLYWCQPRAEQASIREVIDSWALPPPKPVDAVLLALLRGDRAELVDGLGKLGDLWPAAHLVDLLVRAGIGGLDAAVSQGEDDDAVRRIIGAAGRPLGGLVGSTPATPAPAGETSVRDFLLLSFALGQLSSALPSNPGEHRDRAAWAPDPRFLAFGYFAALRPAGLGNAHAEAVMGRFKPEMGSGRGSAGRAADAAGRLVAIGQVMGLSEAAGAAVWRELAAALVGRAGAAGLPPDEAREALLTALAALLRAGETSRADALLDLMLLRAGTPAAPTPDDVDGMLAQLPAATVLPPTLGFYQRFLRFLSLLASGSLDEAGRLLPSLVALNSPPAADLFPSPRRHLFLVLRSSLPLLRAASTGAAKNPLPAVRGAMMALDQLEVWDTYVGTGYLAGGGWDGKGKADEREVRELRGLLVKCVVRCGGFGA